MTMTTSKTTTKSSIRSFVKSTLAAAGLGLVMIGGAAAAELKMWNEPNFNGGNRTFTSATPNLNTVSFNDKAESLKVKSGRWQVCTGINYTGTCRIVTTDIARLKDVGLKDNISSVRPYVAPTTPGILRRGNLTVRQTYLADLDTVNERSAGADMWFQAKTATQLFITPRNGATVRRWGTSKPTYNQCRSVGKSTASVPLSSLSPNTWLCFKTAQGRISLVRYRGISSSYPHNLFLYVETYR